MQICDPRFASNIDHFAWLALALSIAIFVACLAVSIASKPREHLDR